MAISDNLFQAILAMDAYNRGVVGAKLIGAGPIGDATPLASVASVSRIERSEIRGLPGHGSITDRANVKRQRRPGVSLRSTRATA